MLWGASVGEQDVCEWCARACVCALALLCVLQCVCVRVRWRYCVSVCVGAFVCVCALALVCVCVCVGATWPQPRRNGCGWQRARRPGYCGPQRPLKGTQPEVIRAVWCSESALYGNPR